MAERASRSRISCENYSIYDAETETPSAGPWDPVLPPWPHHIETDVDAEGRWTAALATHYVVSFFRRSPEATWETFGELPMPFNPGVGLTRTVLPLSAGMWAIQGGGEIDLVDASAVPAVAAVMRQAEVTPPNLVEYGGYDHLSKFPSAACPNILVGVGAFATPYEVSPRHLVLVDIGDHTGGTYAVRDFGPAGFNAINAAVVELDGQTVLVGSVGTIAETQVFKVFQMTDCGLPIAIAEAPAEFDFATAPLPGFGPDAFQPRSSGAKLAAYGNTAPGRVTFAHYDGYDLRRFHVQKSGADWQVWQETTRLHDTREDLSVPANP